MKKILSLFIIVLILAASPSFAETPRYVEGEAIVVMKTGGVSASARSARGLSLSHVSSSIDAETLGVDVLWNFLPVKAASTEGAARSALSSRGRAAGAASGEEEYAVVRLRSASGESTEQFVARLRENPNVLSATPNYIMKYLCGSSTAGTSDNEKTPAATPDDPGYEYQWGLRRVNMPQVWAQTKDLSDSKEVVVAVIDTGIMYDHEDLKDKMFAFDKAALQKISSQIKGIAPDNLDGSHGAWFRSSITVDDSDFFNPIYHITEHAPVPIGPGGSTDSAMFGDAIGEPTANSRYVGDIVGHGTHVAGIIGAASNNGIGVAGMAPNVKLMAVIPFSFHEDDYEGYISDFVLSDMMRAIDFIIAAKEAGVNIRAVNMSIGEWFYVTDHDSLNPYSQKVKALSDAGIVVCIAAGNDKHDLDNTPGGYYGFFAPAMFRYENTICVGASDENNGRWTGSQYGSNYGSSGKYVDIFAPGAEIVSTCRKSPFYDDDSSNLWYKTGYVYATGTSMASPFVAGAAAALCSVFPEKSATEIKQLIIDGANGSVLKEGNSAHGLLDVYAAWKKGVATNIAPQAAEPGDVAAGASAVTMCAVSKDSLPEAFTVADVVAEADGRLYLDDDTVVNAVNNHDDASGIAAISQLPIFSAAINVGSGAIETEKLIGAAAFSLSGKIFGDGNDLSYISVCKVKPDGTGMAYDYLSGSEARDGSYRILEEDGAAFGGTFSAAKNYTLVLYIEDGGAFDLDDSAGMITDPVAVVCYAAPQFEAPQLPQPSVHSSGGGCSSGTGAAAIFVLPLGALVSYLATRRCGKGK